MSDRKITIKLDKKNLLDVIEELGVLKSKKKLWKPNEIYITLDLPDTKKTYEYLSKSKKVSDWSLGEYSEFVEGHEDIPEDTDDSEILEEHPATVTVKRRETELKSAPKRGRPKKQAIVKEEDEGDSLDTVDKFTKFSLDLIKKEEIIFQGAAYYIEAAWRVCKKSPGIIFGTPLFRDSFEKEYAIIKNDSPRVESALLQKVLEAYYSGITNLNMIIDIEDKIRTRWKQMSQSETLTGVSIMLFKNA